MKFNRKFGLLAVALASIGTGVAAAAAAETDAATSAAAPAPGAGHWHHHARGSMLVGALVHATKQLDLTAEQQQSIKTILSTARAQREANAQASPLDLTVLANPGDPNYPTALQNAKTLAADRIQRESELQNQIYNVLTPQQKTKLPQVLADMKAKFQQRRAAWQLQRDSGAAGAARNG
jgi:Spy/CpxP family protein refolding chaperone